MDDDAIRSLVVRLSRVHASGGTVIERAAVLAEGGDFESVMAWIVAHGGEPETDAGKTWHGGLYGSREHHGRAASPRTPSRFVFPPGALR